MKVSARKGNELRWPYTRQKAAISTIEPDNGFQQFFRKDTACLQGYIDGYDPRLGFETGLVYLSNELTREDYPTVVQIDKDGSFTCKFVIHHPVEQSLTLNNDWIPFYIEPGQTLTMYIDWEAIMARSRAPIYYPILASLFLIGTKIYPNHKRHLLPTNTRNTWDLSSHNGDILPIPYAGSTTPPWRQFAWLKTK